MKLSFSWMQTRWWPIFTTGLFLHYEKCVYKFYDLFFLLKYASIVHIIIIGLYCNFSLVRLCWVFSYLVTYVMYIYHFVKPLSHDILFRSYCIYHLNLRVLITVNIKFLAKCFWTISTHNFAYMIYCTQSYDDFHSITSNMHSNYFSVLVVLLKIYGGK